MHIFYYVFEIFYFNFILFIFLRGKKEMEKKIISGKIYNVIKYLITLWKNIKKLK